jgi:hypothetical protein
MAPNCDIWVLTAMPLRIHWDETLSVGDASQRHVPEGLKPQIIPCEASCDIRVFCAWKAQWAYCLIWFKAILCLNICETSSAPWDMQNWTLRHPHHESPVQILLQLFITAQGSAICQIKFNQYQLMSNNYTVHCMLERTRKVGLCFCARIASEFRWLLSWHTLNTVRRTLLLK